MDDVWLSEVSILFGFIAGGTLVCCIFLWGVRWYIYRASKGKIFENTAQIPRQKTGLVLGCAVHTEDGSPNPYFENRMDAAAELWHSGAVLNLLLSGDGLQEGYDEPMAMKRALVKRGVAEDHIHCDFAGLRTLDSVVRAKKVFQLRHFVVISQLFHIRRAIYIGAAHGLLLHGFTAQDVSGQACIGMFLREQAARVRALLDVVVLKKQPRHLEDPIHID